MKNLIKILLIFLMTFSLCGCVFESKKPQDALLRSKMTNKIIVGVKDDSKPFGFIDKNGNHAGFDIDIAHQIAKRILGDENAVEFVVITPQSRISDLNSRKIDMIIAVMSKNEARSAVVNFSHPYFVAGQAIMVNRGSDINSLSDLNGRNVGFILGTTGESVIRKLAPAANLRAAKSYHEIYKLLKNNEIEAILADDSILYGFLADDNKVKILPRRYTKEQYAIALRKSPESHKLLEAVNEALYAMNQDGTLNKIKNKWVNDLQLKK